MRQLISMADVAVVVLVASISLAGGPVFSNENRRGVIIAPHFAPARTIVVPRRAPSPLGVSVPQRNGALRTRAASHRMSNGNGYSKNTGGRSRPISSPKKSPNSPEAPAVERVTPAVKGSNQAERPSTPSTNSPGQSEPGLTAARPGTPSQAPEELSTPSDTARDQLRNQLLEEATGVKVGSPAEPGRHETPGEATTPDPSTGRASVKGDTHDVKVAKCYPDYSVKSVVHCRSRAASTGENCQAPSLCILYVNGNSTGGSTISPPVAAATYMCHCE